MNSNLRIVSDILDFNKNRPDDIYIYFDKKNISTVYSMIVGPQSTPYFGGYFFFEIKFPSNYPSNSPSVKFLTTDGDVRFNPNLYANGKVCLSILGTWSGPKWEPVMTMKSVLLSIQSLLCEIPLRNEPGYTNVEPTNTISLQYTQYVIYNVYKIGIMDILDNKIIDSVIYREFKDIIILNLKKNYNNLKNDLLSYSEIYGSVPYINPVYSSKTGKINLDFIELCKKFIDFTKQYN